MAKTRATKNSSFKTSIVKSNQKTSLKSPPGCLTQLTTPTKDYPTVTIMTLDKHQIKKKKVDNMASPIDLDPQQNSTNNHHKPTSSNNSPTAKPASRPGKKILLQR